VFKEHKVLLVSRAHKVPLEPKALKAQQVHKVL
jgi:hypothetical protein